MMRDMDELEKLVLDTISISKKERPEVTWLKMKYDEFCQATGMERKADADMLIFERMYAIPPKKDSSVTKIRFWRTGKHVPSNREQAKAFVRALELNDEDTKYFFQGYMDRADMQFAATDTECAEYKERIRVMNELIRDYLIKLHPARRIELGISRENVQSNLRHLYFTDAVHYIDRSGSENKNLKKHIISANYGSELLKNIRLQGEIPRKTMLRHLFVLGMPYISRELIDKNLVALGYLPLTMEHSLQTGERLDQLVIGFLDLYTAACTGKTPEECSRWLTTMLIELDRLLKHSGQMNMRFMYFKGIDIEDT